jgi:pimeloyl-ACP methyl ester carboxylesterase
LLDTPTACVRNAPPAEGRFPLVIYHSGHGSSFGDNSVLCEFLASYGFVAIGSAFQKPDGSPFGVDGAWPSAHDMAFLVAAARQLPGVDPDRVGVIGHSGGAHAALTYGSLPGAAVDAVVSLDTTQDYHGLKDPGWEPMTTLVLRNRKHFKCPLLMVAGPAAFFALADTLQASRRYYFTVKAQVILRRCYGLKAADSLWTRLILDINRATDIVRCTIGQIQELVAGVRAAFACT